MRENHHRRDKEEINALLSQFQQLKAGHRHSYIDEESFEKIIDHYNEKEDLPNALEASDWACNQFPYSSSLLLKKADLQIASRHYKEALEILEKAALLDNNDITLYILKTDAYLALDQQEKAVSLLENALLNFEGGDRIDLLFELADVYDDYGEFDKIFDCLKLILEQDPVNEEALYKICFWTDFTGRNEESIKLHQKIIDEYPYSELAWFNLGAAFQGIKLYEKSIDAYKYALVIDEKFDFAYRNMGDAYIRLRKYKEAIEVLEKVLELSRPEEVIYEAIGHCYDKIKNFAQARFYYRKASHLNQTEAKLYYKIARTYMNEGQWNQAVKQLELATGIVRFAADFQLAMGECKLQLGDIREAIQCFSLVVRSRPRNKAGWEALVCCLYIGEFYEEAMEQVQAALKNTDAKPLFQYYYSAICFALHKPKEGLLQLERALHTAPKLLRKFIQLNPSIMQNQQVVDLLAKFKRNKHA
jgi:tetratricopeptide (TPR) repeat protein